MSPAMSRRLALVERGLLGLFAALFVVVCFVAGCSRDNPVAPPPTPDFECRECPSGGYCPLECYPKEN